MSDSTHPEIFLECKLAASHAVRSLWDKTQKLAKSEGKIPVIALADKHKDGFMVCVHSSDWPAAVDAWLRTSGESPCENEEPTSST